MSSYESRANIIGYLRRTLYGPVGGQDEEIVGTPFLRYLTGILFPQGVRIEETIAAVTATADDVTSQADLGDEGQVESGGGIDLASESLPSAVGISFLVPDGCAVRCAIWAGRYEAVAVSGQRHQRGESKWQRRAIATEESPEVVTVRKGVAKLPVLGGRALLTARWRTRNDATAIVTVALLNAQKAVRRVPDPSLALFQVGLRCEVAEGVFPYPQVGANHDPDSEDAEVEYLYEAVQPFARGHGAAAGWATPVAGRAAWAAVDFIPSVDVPKATFEVGDPAIDPRCCDLKFLATAPRDEVCAALGTLVDAYRGWAQHRRESVGRSGNPAIAERLVRRVEDWLRRMELGTSRLSSDDIAWRSFRIANEAMGIQMALGRARPKVPYSRLERKAPPELDFSGAKWRPFQIAFMLCAMESLLNGESHDRGIMDVIWFPTGGGKTEAYLLVSAFELVRRRLVSGKADTGTAILNRYTLRFLTAQQFQRTGALMVALELIRRRASSELGERPFTLGLWVGDSVTPNTYRKAHEQFHEQFESKAPRNRFLLQACPCCGTEIFPARRGHGRKRWLAEDFGVVSRPDHFRFRCPNAACHFTDWLPLNVIDDALYQEPPSLLLGTVDKFAMLPWDNRARVFFGGVDDQSIPPSLILQDELHLISGPLGSLAAPYEAAIDTIIKLRGSTPKRIGSTATIRNAREQVRGLYGREVAVFPSPAGCWDDAYFFNTDRSNPGRTYVGVMGQGYIKPVVAMAWTSAAILQSVREVDLAPEALDAYWSLLAYHNSRRELGRTLTAAQDEVQARIKAVASSEALARTIGEPLELSAQMVKSLGEAIEALEKPYAPGDPPVDFVPCTSIISVGVDLDRLGIMLMNGQPKLTSEYIQATSRVGRGKVPGLVVSLFSATKPRDRSHYEDFRAYHESIYRHVEPTSVTPYALPARERTLHAALVAVIRHATKYSPNESAKQVDFADPFVQQCIASLLEVMCSSDLSEAKEVAQLMEYRLGQWRDESESGFQLLYERLRAGHQFPSLLTDFGRAKAGALWPTMMSVRNVDAEVSIKVA